MQFQTCGSQTMQCVHSSKDDVIILCHQDETTLAETLTMNHLTVYHKSAFVT